MPIVLKSLLLGCYCYCYHFYLSIWNLLARIDRIGVSCRSRVRNGMLSISFVCLISAKGDLERWFNLRLDDQLHLVLSRIRMNYNHRRKRNLLIHDWTVPFTRINYLRISLSSSESLYKLTDENTIGKLLLFELNVQSGIKAIYMFDQWGMSGFCKNNCWNNSHQISWENCAKNKK